MFCCLLYYTWKWNSLFGSLYGRLPLNLQQATVKKIQFNLKFSKSISNHRLLFTTNIMWLIVVLVLSLYVKRIQKINYDFLRIKIEESIWLSQRLPLNLQQKIQFNLKFSKGISNGRLHFTANNITWLIIVLVSYIKKIQKINYDFIK